MTAQRPKPSGTDAIGAWMDALAGGDPWADREPVATRLADWLDWTASIALAAEVKRTHPSSATGLYREEERIHKATTPRLVEQGRLRLLDALRSTMQEAVAEWALADTPGRDTADLRRGVTRAQRLMDDGVARLRSAVRDRLRICGPEGQELAAIDAVLEQALAERQRHLLSGAAGRLARLGENAAFPSERPEAPSGPGASGTVSKSSKVTVGRLAAARLLDALMAPLSAELELRLQPLRGLEQSLHHTEL